MDPTRRSNGADGGTLGLIGQISPPPPKWPDFANNLSLKRSLYKPGAMQFWCEAGWGAIWERAEPGWCGGIFLGGVYGGVIALWSILW